MKYELIFPQPLLEMMRDHLFEGKFSGKPLGIRENACLCLAGLVRGKDKVRFLVREIDIPEESEVERGGSTVRINASVYHRLRRKCRDYRLCIIDVHSHPFGGGFFSRPDLQTLEGVGYWANTIHENCPMAMMVHGSVSVAGRYYDLARDIPGGTFDELRVIGRQWRRYRMDGQEGAADWNREENGNDADAMEPGVYNRQMLCWGKHGQREINELHIAILGVGGVGALAAETFARLGVSELTLVDMDVVSESNLSRLSGAYPANPFQSGDVGAPKVDVISRHLRRINPDIRLSTYRTEFENPDLETPLALSDMLYVAVDTLESRLRSHELAAKYLLPVVEAATGINADLRSGVVRNMGSIFQFFIPATNGCRYCFPEMSARPKAAGVIGPKGYVWGTALNPEAAILPQNAFINALACHQVTKYVTGFGEPFDRIRYDGISEVLTRVRRPLNPACPMCSSEQRLALGAFGRLGSLDDLLEAGERTEEEIRLEEEMLTSVRTAEKGARESRTAHRHQTG